MKKVFLPLLLAFVAHSSYAAYAVVTPPSTFNVAASTMRIAANDLSFAGGFRGAAGVANVAGKAIVMPAAYRFAANAGVLAARAAFGNPWLFAVGIVASGVYQYYKNDGFSVVDGVWNREILVDGTVYKIPGLTPSYASLGAACNAWGAYVSSVYGGSVPYVVPSSSCLASGATAYRGGDVTYPVQPHTSFTVQTDKVTKLVPATQAEFEAGGPNVHTIPAGVPQAWPLPGQMWEVLPQPILNPTPVDPAVPLAVPTPQPLRVPVGDPVLVPGSNPSVYKSPVIDIVPSPTVSEPWRVDVQPKDLTSPSPNPLDVAPVPQTPASGTTTTQTQPGLCDQFPNILACTSPGDVVDSPLPAAPVLYEAKYPDGLMGVWTTQKAALLSSPLFGLMSSLMPSSIGGGACPSWVVPLDLGAWHYGSFDVAPPCYVWEFAKAIIIVSALLLARALIFGG